jgi:hypothetical protein
VFDAQVFDPQVFDPQLCCDEVDAVTEPNTTTVVLTIEGDVVVVRVFVLDGVEDDVVVRVEDVLNAVV